MRLLVVLFTIASAFAWQATMAAELRLRQQCSPKGAVITLGEVADIYTADKQQAEKLAATELFPAPSATQQRVIRVRELQDLLIMRGVKLAECQFSGSSQVVVTAACEPTHAEHDQSLTISATKRAQRRLQEAVLQYLQTKSSTQVPRIVQFEPTPALAQAAANTAQSIAVSGGSSPWTGKQRFEVAISTLEGPARFTLDAEVSVPVEVVAAAHSLSRGAVIRESDLVLSRDSTPDGEGGAFHAIAEVVGRQTTRAIPDGKILAADDVQAPRMVHRGDVVTVYARSAGICVRTTARAREEGGLGDLVTMETMQDRKTYQARVCGMREAEVLAQAILAADENQ